LGRHRGESGARLPPSPPQIDSIHTPRQSPPWLPTEWRRSWTFVLVRIANYARAYERGDGTLHLIEYVERELFPRSDFGRYIRRVIEQGKALMILDSTK
jgi:hypothetical protein